MDSDPRMSKERFDRLVSFVESGDPIKDLGEDDGTLADALIAERVYADAIIAEQRKRIEELEAVVGKLPKLADVNRTFVVIPTGECFDDQRLVHVGSAICGEFAWHVYEEQN